MSLYRKYMLMIAYTQMLIFNVPQMLLSIYADVEIIKDIMYLKILILMLFYKYSALINYQY